MDSSSPPRSFRPRARPLVQPSSPLNPAAPTSPPVSHPINPLRRTPNSLDLRKSSFPYTPSRFSPRSSLSFLEPTLTSSSSTSSSPDSVLRTPPLLATSGGDFPMPSPNDLPPAHIDHIKHLKRHDLAPINIPGPGRRFSTLSASSQSPNDPRPIVVQRLDSYMNVPASPPIIDPHYLLGKPIVHNDANQHSIAAPFANLNLNPSPTEPNPPPVTASPLHHRLLVTNIRRPSALAHEFGKFNDDTGDDTDTDTDTDATDDDSPHRVPSPLSRP
jgi:hypothetical protein